MIRRLSIRNFKSFDKLDLELARLNVVVGANASGKSNFLQMLKFVRDIGRYNLDDAIAIQGGIALLRNVREPKSIPTVIEIVDDSNMTIGIPSRSTKSENRNLEFRAVKVEQITRSLRILPKQRGPGYTVTDDSVLFEIRNIPRRKDEAVAKNTGTMKLTKKGRSIVTEFHYPDVTWEPDSDFMKHVSGNVGDCMSFAGNPVGLIQLLIMHPGGKTNLNISTFDFDARLFKKAVRISGRSGLDESGENLAVILQDILRNKTNRKLLMSHLIDLLPFVTKLETERFTDNTLLFSLLEKYYAKGRFPASVISDGTVSIIAILVALLFDRSEILAIEEPERNVHPQLISQIIEIARNISKNKQIVITTHSPAVVEAAKLEELYVVKRDTSGYTRITRPADSSTVRKFLEHDLGVRQLFESNLLGK